MPAIDFSKDAKNNEAEDNMVKDNAVILSAFYKGDEVKLIYRGDKKIFESKRLYTTFIAEKNPNNSDDQYLHIADLSTLGKITELYINGVLQDVQDIPIQTSVNVKIKGQFTVQDSNCDMHSFFVADGLESVVNVGNTMFRDCIGITDLDLTYFNTSTIKTNMQNLFAGCTNLKTVNINNFDMTKITNVNSMFNGCFSLKEIDISGWKNTNNIERAESVFRDCSNLEKVYLPKLPSLTTMRNMFNNCTNLKLIDMRNIDGSNLTSATVDRTLLKVPSSCEIYVSSNFPFSESQLGWDGTFKTK